MSQDDDDDDSNSEDEKEKDEWEQRQEKRFFEATHDSLPTREEFLIYQKLCKEEAKQRKVAKFDFFEAATKLKATETAKWAALINILRKIAREEPTTTKKTKVIIQRAQVAGQIVGPALRSLFLQQLADSPDSIHLQMQLLRLLN
jgi:hypothetical protein